MLFGTVHSELCDAFNCSTSNTTTNRDSVRKNKRISKVYGPRSMSSVTDPKPGSAGREIRVRIMTEISAIELKAQEFTVAFTLEASYMEDLKASEER